MSALLRPLSAAFGWGVAVRHAAYRHGWFKTHRLARPVVSVGNLTVGGTGKTPLVEYIAKLLVRHGRKPAILTRGYGRGSKDAMILLPPGADRRPDARELGDEPALLARAIPEVPLVICADRVRGGRAAENHFQVDAHILDDGFQHLALARDLDVLVLDATQPLSDRNLLPAGRQREPLSAIQRAQIVALTRTESADPAPLEELLRQVHPAARAYRSQMKLLGWANALNGENVPMESLHGRKVAAFCALGNPQAFFTGLRRWGFELAAQDAFPDHHVYTEEEIERLAANARAQGAVALLTTRKDAIKFSPHWTVQPPILACAIEIHFPDAGAFESTLLSCLAKAH